MRKSYGRLLWLIAGFVLAEGVLAALARLPDKQMVVAVTYSLIAVVFAEVSLALLWGAMYRLSIGSRVALAAAVSAAGAATASAGISDWDFVGMGTILLLMQAVMLSSVLLALALSGIQFGPLSDASAAATSSRQRWQTSIGSLLLLTTTTAASLSLLKWLIPVDRLYLDAERISVYFVLSAGNVSLVVGLAALMLATGAHGPRAAIGIACMTLAGAAYFWLAQRDEAILLIGLIVVQSLALIAGLAVFRSCGWRIAWRRSTMAAQSVSLDLPAADCGGDSPAQPARGPDAERGE